MEILRLIRDNPQISAPERAKALGITVKGVEWQIRNLKASGLLKHTGPTKGGRWEVIS